MKLPKSLLNIVGLILGGVGVLGTLILVIMIWVVSVRVDRVTVDVFAEFDRSLDTVKESVSKIQDRVEESKITTERIETALKDWTQRETGKRLAVRLDVVGNSEKLLSATQQADDWLELSETTVKFVQTILAMSDATGAPIDPALVDEILEEIASLRTQLGGVTDLATKLHDRTLEASEEKSARERINQALKLALRVVTTLGSIDEHLVRFQNRLSEKKKELHLLESKSRRWIFLASIVISMLILWMTVGQFSLCYHSWIRLRKRDTIPNAIPKK